MGVYKSFGERYRTKNEQLFISWDHIWDQCDDKPTMWVSSKDGKPNTKDAHEWVKNNHPEYGDNYFLLKSEWFIGYELFIEIRKLKELKPDLIGDVEKTYADHQLKSNSKRNIGL